MPKKSNDDNGEDENGYEKAAELATLAFAISQADSSAPGPADVIAAGVGIYAIIVAVKQVVNDFVTAYNEHSKNRNQANKAKHEKGYR